MNRSVKKSYPIILLLLVVAVTVLVDLFRISHYKMIPKDPPEKIITEQDQVYFDLVNGESEIDWTRLNGTLRFISEEYDCSDFRLVNLIRILYEYEDQIPREYLSKIEDARHPEMPRWNS